MKIELLFNILLIVCQECICVAVTRNIVLRYKAVYSTVFPQIDSVKCLMHK